MATTKKATTVVKDDAKKVTVKEEPVKETAKPAEKADAKTAVKGEEKSVAEVKTVCSLTASLIQRKNLSKLQKMYGNMIIRKKFPISSLLSFMSKQKNPLFIM